MNADSRWSLLDLHYGFIYHSSSWTSMRPDRTVSMTSDSLTTVSLTTVSMTSDRMTTVSLTTVSLTTVSLTTVSLTTVSMITVRLTTVSMITVSTAATKRRVSSVQLQIFNVSPTCWCWMWKRVSWHVSVKTILTTVKSNLEETEEINLLIWVVETELRTSFELAPLLL